MSEVGISSFKCPLCVFAALTIPLVLSHLRLVHSSDPNFSVVCGVGGCCTTAKSFSALYQHIYKKHRDAGIVASRHTAAGASTPPADTPSCSSSYMDSMVNESGDSDLDHLLGLDTKRQKQASALFLLKLKETRQLSQAAIDDVVEGCRSVFAHTVQRLHNGTRAKLATLGVEETALDEVFTDTIDPFSGLETRYKQEKCFKEVFTLVEPREIFVGEPYYPARCNGSKRSLVEHRDSFQYVSIIDTLKSLLKDESILEYIDHPHPRSDGLLEDFCDGELFNKHPLFSSDTHALQIVAYYDDLEVCNPLGTHRKQHKLGIILFTLGNIPPKCRSILRAINLVVCAEQPVIEKHGLDSILKPFVEDLNSLTQKGISVKVRGVEQTYRGGLLCFLGDNLASNALGGFKQSFSFSFRFCRSCMATKESYREHFLPHNFHKRTDTDHRQHCDSLEGPLKNHNSKTYGVNRKTVLMDVMNYSLFDGGLPHDFMHDILEGVAQYEIKLLIRHCIDLRYITREEYNRRIVFFDYGSSETDKPGIITRDILQSEDTKFHLSSSQTLLLCRILPMMIGERVPHDSPAWKCFILLLKIIDIVISPVVSKGLCGWLRILIDEHHSLFRDVYGSTLIIPKFHFMLHYPNQIIALGPMVRSWTMCHEAKLNFFKRGARLGNFKNIAFTLAQRHQRWMCYQSASGDLLRSLFECGPGGQSYSLASSSPSIIHSIREAIPNISDDASIFQPNWVKKEGIRYHSNNCYVITGSDGTDPVFSRIMDLFVVGGDLLLLHVQTYRTLYFDEHFHAYVVHKLPQMSIVCIDSLLSPFVLHSHKLFDGSHDTYISLKHSFL